MNEIRKLATGERLDTLLSDENLSRSQAARLIKEGQAKVNGIVVAKPSFIPNFDDEVVLTLPEATESGVLAEDIPISLVYEDEALAIINKPAGLVVHPAAGQQSGTLVNALLYHLEDLSGIGGEKRPGIVHRLDKDTSGLLMVAKNDKAHLALSRALAERKIEKYYLAMVAGHMKEEEGRYEGPIGRSPRDRKKMAVVPDGRDALTIWRTVSVTDKSTLVLIRLMTGRTHQIRVHFSKDNHTVLGDVIYGHRGLPPAPRLMLHAWSLGFEHPITGKSMRFFAQPDAIFKAPDEQELKALLPFPSKD